MGLAVVKGPPAGTGLQVRAPSSLAWEIAADPWQGFDEYYARMHGPLLDHAERFLDREDARDATSETMVAIWWQWATLSAGKRGEKYAFGILTNIVRAMLKANSQLVSLTDAEPELDRLSLAEAPAFHGTSGDPRVEVLEAALAAMPARRREVLLLRYEQGFSHREVAAALGLARSTVNTHVSLGYEDLRAAFTRAGYQVPDAKPRRQLRGTSSKGPRRLLPGTSSKGVDTND